jgi:hypothetical protein
LLWAAGFFTAKHPHSSCRIELKLVSSYWPSGAH